MRTKLTEGELLLLKAKKHWFYVGIPILVFVIFLILYIYVCSVSQSQKLAGILWVLPVGSFLLFVYRYLDRKYNIWVVTNHRVIDEWGIIAHNAKETPLDRIQNSSYMQSILGRIFGFGDVRIQTAASQGAVVYSLVERPKLLSESIIQAQAEYRKIQVKEQAQEMAREMTLSAPNIHTETDNPPPRFPNG
jgi:uncharacterized membrane protein YdbT with pleckstrin-like domain